MKHLIIRSQRDHCDVSEIRGMTVEELISELRCYDPDAIVAVNMDGGYYGGLSDVADWGISTVDGFSEVNY